MNTVCQQMYFAEAKSPLPCMLLARGDLGHRHDARGSTVVRFRFHHRNRRRRKGK